MASAPKLALIRGTKRTVQSPERVWLEEERRWKIECAPRAMEEIRACAVRGLSGIGHGGVEVGGVLLGTRLGSFLRISGWRPIACQHAFGPAFILSEQDKEDLGQLLQSLSTDEGTRELQALGWFVSHTRREPVLDEQEQRVFASFFPGEGALALVVRPRRFGEMEVRVHARLEEGSAAEALQPAFVVEPAPLPSGALRAERAAPAATAPLATAQAAEPASSVFPAVAAAATPRRSWQNRLLPAVMLLGLAATAGFVWRQLPLREMLASLRPAVISATPRPLHLLSLHAGPTPEGLRLSWSTSGGWIAETDHAVVEFVSRGNQSTTQTLGREDLSRGSLTLDHSASSHEVALTVFAGGNRTLVRERVTLHPAP